jgi:hypothetical protein
LIFQISQPNIFTKEKTKHKKDKTTIVKQTHDKSKTMELLKDFKITQTTLFYYSKRVFGFKPNTRVHIKHNT